jgi:biopolymer transport protein ExbD
MRFKTTLKPSTNLIDLTPLVDVIFLLLIFFIVTSDILPLKSLNIENPTLDKKAPSMTTQVIVIMDASQVIYVGSKKVIVDFETLKEALLQEIALIKKQSHNEQPTIVVSVDRQVEYGAFLKLFAIVQECSSKIRLSYKPLENNA